MPKKFTLSDRRKAPTKTRENDSSSSSSWEDRDKNLKKKQQRKEEQTKKREQQLARKAEAKKLLHEETCLLKSGKLAPLKVTRAEIKTTLGSAMKGESTKGVASLQENVNRAKGEEVAARGVDEAINVLNNKEEKDKHPEKRMKAAYEKFESRRIKELRIENPELKLSKVREMVFKEWLKSAENPMNQI